MADIRIPSCDDLNDIFATDVEAELGTRRDKLLNVAQARELYKNHTWETVDYETRTITSDGHLELIRTKEFIVKKNRGLTIDLSVPLRTTDKRSWNGCYIYLNVSIDGTWFFIGNSGFDGATMTDVSHSIATYTRNISLNLDELTGDAPREHRVVINLAGKAYNYDVTQNGAHSINEESQSNFEDIGVARTSKFFTNLTATEIYWGGYLWNM